MQNIIDDIVETRDTVKTGEWRGQSEDVDFYIKGDDVVLLSKSGEFITILKGGVNNARVKDARDKEV
jgi:hypothetical protein